MEYVKTNDTVIFTANFYHPASGYSMAADTTPQYLVYEGTTGAAILNGAMSARTDHTGAYYGSFTASAGNGFDSGTFYDVQVSGIVAGTEGIASVKQFVLDDVFSANTVQVSGEYVSKNWSTLTASNVYTQVDNAIINNSLDMLPSQLSAIDADVQLIESNVISISGDVTGLNGDAMRGTDNAALAATALTNATWTDERAAYLDSIPNLSTKTDVESVSGVLVARTLVSADYFDPATDTVAQVTLVDTVTDITNIVQANMVQISGSNDTLRNFGYTFDGTGYGDDYAPAQQQQLSNLANVGSAVNTAPDAVTIRTGTPINSYTDTAALDGVRHTIIDVTDVTDFDYRFNIGSDGIPASIIWKGYANNNGDSYQVYASGMSGWEQIGTIVCDNLTSNRTETFDTLITHVNDGKVNIRFASTDAQGIATDQILCSYSVVNRSVGYADGAIWIDTNGGTAGTTPFINGTADNPVSNWTDALSLHNSLGMQRFRIVGNSTIQLSSDSSNHELIGDGLWNLDLNGQTVTGIYVKNAIITGTGNGTGTLFEDCSIRNSASVPAGFYVRCGISAATGTPMTGSTAGEYAFVDCISTIAGSATPHMDFSGLGSSSGINFRRWSGGSNTTIDSNNTISLEVVGGGGQTVTTNGGNVEIRGTCRSVTVSVTGSETVQFVGVTGPITLNDDGASAATFNLYGIASAVTDNTTGSTVNDYTAKGPSVNAILADTNELQTDDIPGLIAGLNNFDPAVDTVAHVTLVDTTTTNTDMRGTNNAALATDLMSVSGSIIDTLGTMDQDVYFADIKYIRDNINSQDEYSVQWFKNDQPVGSGSITTPAISVYNTSNGSNIVTNQLMTYASPSLGVVRYNETSSLLASGEPYLVETSGTIDASVRTWKTVVGIDYL